jgi:hypothetical protein
MRLRIRKRAWLHEVKMRKPSIFELVIQRTDGEKSRSVRITIGSLVAFVIVVCLVFVYLILK